MNKQLFLLRANISGWMREEQGIGDDDIFNAGEVEETLECYFDYMVKSITEELSSQ